MTITHDVLDYIIFRKKEICCLCLKPVENYALSVQDETVFINEKTIDFVKIVDVLGVILDSETLDTLSPWNSLCKRCSVQAITAYKFIKTCRNNRRYVMNATDSILTSLPAPELIDTCKSVFVVLNSKGLISTSLFDTKSVKKSKRTTLKRFQKLIKSETKRNQEELNAANCLSPKIISDDEIDVTTNEATIIKQVEVKQPKRKSLIPLSEIRVDESDFKCKVCLKTYQSSQHLRQHYIRVHAPKVFQCLKCPKTYGTKSLLNQHKYDSHTPTVCTECGKTYQNRHSLKMHEMGHSQKIMCSNCGRIYKHWKTYNKHVSQDICKQKEFRPRSEAKFSCDYCSKRFTNKGTLRVHIQFEHGNGNAHVCPWCSKKFHAQSRLKAHIVKHTQEKKFCCDLCGGKFVTKESLLYHTRIHTGDKPYQCNLCENRFLSSSRRAEHIRRYHMAPMFECEICHSKFKDKSCLVKHRKRHFNPKSKLHCSERCTEAIIK